MKREPTHDDERGSVHALERYNEMRDFERTREPNGRVARSKTGHSFVVQKHAARRLHYDFRLELDGVLLSWAVPKGPSLVPGDKRLAVEVEDHPLDYRDFEGTIPQGQYGGGAVIVWDRGTWEPIGDPHAGLKKGHLDFTLDGEKLHGRFMLIRTKGDEKKPTWLLMKRSDEFVQSKDEKTSIVDLEPASVLTGRTIEDIVAGVPATTTTTTAKPTRTKRVAKKSAAKKPGSTKERKTNQRATNQRATNQRATNQRATNQRATNQRATNQRATNRPATNRPATNRRAAKQRASNAKGSPLPPFSSISPQLATLVKSVPTGDDWLYEIKYDGYRTLAWLDDGKVRMASRRGLDWTDKYEAIAGALSRVRAKTAIFDGEVAYVLDDGRTSFQELQHALGSKSPEQRARLVYFIFDLLFYDGVDLRDQPLSYRKDKLRTILAGEKPPLKMSDDVNDGKSFFREACRLDLEGIIGKRASATYVSKRTPDWVKVKCDKRQEMVIVGFTPPAGRRQGIGALLVGVHATAKKSSPLRYAGKVGTGFSNVTLADLAKRLSKLVTDEPPVDNPPRNKDAIWVEPKLVCEVRFSEWTKDGILRHPSFQGLRLDKTPSEVHREESSPSPPTSASRSPSPPTSASRSPSPPTSASRSPSPTPSPSSPSPSPSRAARTPAATTPSQSTRAKSATTLAPRHRGAAGIDVDGVKVSHPERVMDEATGLTKLDVVRYMAGVAEVMLPYIERRPLMLLRCPGGKKPSCFVQKHQGQGLQHSNVGHMEMGNGEEALFVSTPKEIITLAQNNTVELHGWGSRVPKWDRADWIVLDLDPDEDLPFATVIDAAFEVRDALKTLGLASWVKTTGGKGLHVVVPITRRYDWPTIKRVSQQLALLMARAAPNRYVANMSKKARTGKIFVDYLRNAEGATAVLPYSPRARPGLTVATPIAWRDLRAIDSQELTIESVPKLLARRHIDPWSDMLDTKQALPRELLDAALK